MYKPATFGSVAAGGGAVATLPTTGADTVITIAVAVALGLGTWGLVYFYQARRIAKARK